MSYYYITKEDDLIDKCNLLSRKSILGWDIEARVGNHKDAIKKSAHWLNSDVLSIQLGDQHTQCVFHAGSFTKKQLKPVFDIIEDRDIIKVGHNLKFDYEYLKYHYGVNPNNIRDTFILENLINKGIRKNGFSLDYLLKSYLNIEADKSVRDHFYKYKPSTPFTDEDIKYSADDVKYMIPLYNEIYKVVAAYDLKETAALECENVMATGDLELNGVLLDAVEWKALETQAIKDCKIVKAKLDKLIQPYANMLPMSYKKVDENQLSLGLNINSVKINFASPTQLKPLLSLVLGVDLPNTQEDTLVRFSKGNPVVEALLELRGLEKRISTYGQNIIDLIRSDGYLHPVYNQVGTDSGRKSSKDPNGQNFPARHNKNDPDYRKPFKAGKGRRMICADYSGCELRIIAELSGEESWINAFKKGWDMHTFVSSIIRQQDYLSLVNIGADGKHTVKDEFSFLRREGKTLNFG